MNFPPENSALEQVCKYIATTGQVTAAEVKKATGLSVNTVAKAYQLGFLTRFAGQSIKAAYVYEVTPKIREFLAFGAKTYQGTIVPPRVVNVLNTPEMKGYDEMMRKGRNLREASFHRTFASALPR